VLVVTGIHCLLVIGLTASYSLGFLFTQLAFQWSQAAYSFYTTLNWIAETVVVATVCFLGFKVFRIPNAILGIMISATGVIGYTVWAFSVNALMFYLGNLIKKSVATE